MKGTQKRDFAYVGFFLIIVMCLVLLGKYYIEEMRHDYNSKILDLEARTEELEVELDNKQGQIFNLDGSLY